MKKNDLPDVISFKSASVANVAQAKKQTIKKRSKPVVKKRQKVESDGGDSEEMDKMERELEIEFD